MRLVDPLRPGPMCTRSRSRPHAPASGGTPFASVGTQPGRSHAAHSWRERSAPRPPERSHDFTTATGPWRSPGQGHVTPDRRGRPTHRLRPVAARYLRWPSGRGCSSPATAGGCHLTVSRPVGRAVPATVIRAGVSVLGAASSPIAGDRHLTVSRPASRAVPAIAIRAGRVTPIAGDCHHTVSTSLPLTAAGQPVVFPRALRARARGRAGPTRHHHRGLHSSPASRPHHHVTSGPGPAAGLVPARAAHLSQPTGRLQSAHTTTVSARPASRRQRTGRCGVLTRIRVGAAATAGPGRPHATRTSRARTTRHGDEAAASSSCRLPVPLKVLQGCTRCFE